VEKGFNAKYFTSETEGGDSHYWFFLNSAIEEKKMTNTLLFTGRDKSNRLRSTPASGKLPVIWT
jgi:hypothetical protein